MPLPSADVAEYWAVHRRRPLAGTAWGIGLERDGSVLHNAGGGSTPGVVLDADAAAPTVPADVAGLVLHDVADLDGALDVVRAAFPGASWVHRYDAGRCDFGADPERFAQEHLSARRRKRLRADRRRLAERGEVVARWARADEVAQLYRGFHALTVARARATGQWDAAVADDGELADQWAHLGGSSLSIHVLSVGGVPVSYRTGFVVGRYFVGYKPIVDRDVDKVSLGDLHMRLLIDDLAEAGVATYLMGKGANDHKDVWATGRYSMWGVVVATSRSPRARLAIGAALGRQHARRLLTRSGIETPLRRALHRWYLLTDRAYRAALADTPAVVGSAVHSVGGTGS